MQLGRKDPRLARRKLELGLLREKIPMDTPIASDVKVFVPAINFRQSLEFYKAMGWNINWRADDDSLAELELADCRFYLQNYYNEVRLRANCDALADTSTEAFGFSP